MEGNVIDDPIDESRALVCRQERPGRATSFSISPNLLSAIVDAFVAHRQQKYATTSPPASHAPPAQDAPSASHAPDPLHVVQGDPLHAVQSDPFPSSIDPREARPPPAAHAQKDDPPPHMNAAGFVISERAGKIIAAATIKKWRGRFPHLPDLETAISSLALNLRQRGPMHKGWEYPEAWMAKPLAEMNQEAALKRQVADAKTASLNKGGTPRKTFPR